MAGTRFRGRPALIASLIALTIALGPPPAGAATSPGQIYGFGTNTWGELGTTTNLGPNIPNPTPTLVELPGASGPATEIAVGGAHSLALTSSGQLYAFGFNKYGQLGSATNSGTENPNPTPTPVDLPAGSDHVTQIAAASGYSLFLTSGGQLYAFGENRYGQLGSATNSGTTEPNPTPIPVSLQGASGPATEIAAGGNHSLALTSTGQLYAFGQNYFGQLGSPTNNNTNNPNPTPTLVALQGASGPVTQISAGIDHSLALTSTGQLYAFGKNFTGELGRATNIETVNPNPTPVPVSLPGASGPVTQIAAGGFHSLALTSTGQLFAFGDNIWGQLGIATNSGTAHPNWTPALVSLPGASGPVVQIAGGGGHSLAVTSSGQLYGFGYNYFGQLGNATNNLTGNPNPTPTLVSLPADTTVDTVARDPADHALVLIANLVVTTESMPSGQVGAPFSATATAQGGTAPFTWQASGLPAGLSIDSASGQISGAPQAAGTAQVTLSVSDHFGIVASSAPLALSIESAAVVAGRAFAARVAHVKRGKALLTLRCRGGGPCKGVVKLLLGRKLIGKARFSIALGKSKVIRVKLNGRGKKLLARRHRLKVKMRGSGVRPRTVLLK